jgi:hypothetical protein
MDFLRTRRFWTGLGLFLLAAAAIAAYGVPPWPSFLNWVFDVLAFAGSLVVGLMLISQFVLPVQTMRERRAVFDHFMQYVSGNYGPIIFVKDGKIVGRKEELHRYGHGVALVDPVSAIVIERAAARHWWSPAVDMDEDTDGTPRPRASGPALVRAAGPGIDFIAPGERIVAALDLRKQSRGIAAKGLTRDGLECSAFISVTFSLDPGPEKMPVGSGPAPAGAAATERNKPAYRFNRGSAFRAVYGVALGEKQAVDWTELPLHVAVERFRDVLSEYKLDELFAPTKPDVYPFSTFTGRITSLVKDAPVLRERGLLVYGVGVGGFAMPREVLNQRVRSWQARWQKATIQQEAAVETQSLRTESRYQIDAQRLIFKDVQSLAGATDDPAARKALAYMLVKALRRAAADPSRRKQLPAETLHDIEALQEPDE